MVTAHKQSAIDTFLASCNVGDATGELSSLSSPLWQDYEALLGPLWQTYGNPVDKEEWSLPYATLIGNLLNRVMRLTDVHDLLDTVVPRTVLVPLLAPPGDIRELHQTQYRFPLVHTFRMLREVDALSILTVAGYLPPDPSNSTTLWFVVRGVADWHRADAMGAEARPSVMWREPALMLEHELELPYFAELTFPGSRSATLADEYRASLLSGRLRPREGVHWMADWLRSGQYVVERRAFEALLRGIVKDWLEWRAPTLQSGVRARLRRLREFLSLF